MSEGGFELLAVAKRFRHLVRSSISFCEAADAVFWADKLVSLTSNNIEDFHLLCKSLFLDKQYKRCAIMIKESGLEAELPVFRLLTARCHFELCEWEEALSVLEGGDYNCFTAAGKPKPTYRTHISGKANMESIDWGLGSSQIKSRIHLLLGKVYEAIENRELAERNFREALKLDVFCHEAFQRLTQHHLLSGQEEEELFSSLQFEDQCSNEDCNKVVKFLYENNLKKYHKVSRPMSAIAASIPPQVSQSLMKNNEVSNSLAERLFFNNKFYQCYSITKAILRSEPFYKPTLLLHISVLVELSKSNELFSLAHSLIDFHPESAVSWLAVGCYYFLIGKQDPARRFLRRAISIDNMNGPCWLVNAHSFAAENEHDQAMAAYFTAAKLMRGFHLPSLYIGLEYTVTNNLPLAEKFTREASVIAPDDPNVLHELGVIMYIKGNLEASEKYLIMAMHKLDELQNDVPSQKWQPLLNNLAHVYRATGKYHEAVQLHERALNLNPNNAATHSSLGLVYCYLFNWSEAISHFHRALSLRREDAFTVAMLKLALEKALAAGDPANCVSSFEAVTLSDIRSTSPKKEKHPGNLSGINFSALQANTTNPVTGSPGGHQLSFLGVTRPARGSSASFLSNASGDDSRTEARNSLMDLDDHV